MQCLLLNVPNELRTNRDHSPPQHRGSNLDQDLYERGWIPFQSDTRDTYILTVQSRVVNPCPKALVMSQSMSNLQPKVAGVRIDEARCYTSIASVPMYEVQIRVSHLPRLLNNSIKHTIPDNGGWVASV